MQDYASHASALGLVASKANSNLAMFQTCPLPCVSGGGVQSNIAEGCVNHKRAAIATYATNLPIEGEPAFAGDHDNRYPRSNLQNIEDDLLLARLRHHKIPELDRYHDSPT